MDALMREALACFAEDGNFANWPAAAAGAPA
jgi:hypothetical protein